MPEYLTTGEFQRWADDDRELKKRILDHIENQALVNADFQSEIAVMKAAHSKSRNFNAGLSSVVSAIVAGCISALKH